MRRRIRGIVAVPPSNLHSWNKDVLKYKREWLDAEMSALSGKCHEEEEMTQRGKDADRLRN